MIFYSIITVANGDARGAKITARSLAVQNDAPPFQWILVSGSAPQAAEDEIPLPTAEIADDINQALEKATGEYVWFLPAGACLADASVLRNTKRELVTNLLPDLYYAAWREHGIMMSPKSFSALNGSMIAPLAAMLLRRRVIGDLLFSDEYRYAADYDFVLRFADKATKIVPSEKIIIDIDAPSLKEALPARAERFVIRRRLLQQRDFKNKLIDWGHRTADGIRMRFPKVYRAARNIVYPPPNTRKVSPVKSKYRGIFFKKR